MLCRCTPTADTRKPPPKQNAAMKLTLRGPLRSAHVPRNAADNPRMAIATLKIQYSSTDCFQSPAAGAVIPSSRLIGSLKTLNP